MKYLPALYGMLMTVTVVAQQSVYMVRGVVVDSQNNSPVTDVHVTTSRQGVVTDMNGAFEISVPEGDSLHFSHVAYQPEKYGVDKSVTDLIIHLVPRVRVLREVNIFSFPTESEFKSTILSTEPTVSWEVAAAAENSERMREMARFAPMTKTHADLFFESLREPQGFTFLSSNPSRGLSAFIRSVRRKEQYSFRDWRIPAGGNHPIRIRRVLPVDTVIVANERDSLGVGR